MRASRGLKWENKMYKLKRSIGKTTCERFDAESTHADNLSKYSGSWPGLVLASSH